MLRPAFHTTPIRNNQSWYYVFPIALVIMLAGTFTSGAQSHSSKITIEKGGQAWIEGSAGMINYNCRADELSGAGKIENTQNPQATVKGEGAVHISVELPVQSLNCGKRAMNRDMYRALKAERFSSIRYTLLNASLAAQPTDSNSVWMPISTRGIMEIAGVQDTTTVLVQGQLLSDRRFRVKGSKQLHMDTYQITPPTAMFGLIRANKELTVHFDVTVQLEENHK